MRRSARTSRAWVVTRRLCFAYVTCSVLFVAGPVFAQESPSDIPVATSTIASTTTTEKRPLGNALFSLTPMVANERAKPRDILKKELTLTNNTNQMLDVYLDVENIDPNGGASQPVSPGVADLSVSLANWVEITRGVIELSPGESRKVPYLIHVNLSAKPGSYFARIRADTGPVRPQSANTTLDDGTYLMLNVEIADTTIERLHLGNFMANTSVVFSDSADFSYSVENVGNKNLEPRGTIRIFNRRGEEVGSIPLNANSEQVTPDDKKQMAASWNASGRFGKYKAFLDLQYGDLQTANLQDTVYFWVFPWKEMLASLVGVFVLGIIGTLIVHMRAVSRVSYAAASVSRGSEQGHETSSASYPHVSVRSAVPTHSVTESAGADSVSRDRASLAQTLAQAPVPHVVQVRESRPQAPGSVVQLVSRSARGRAAPGSTVTIPQRRA